VNVTLRRLRRLAGRRSPAAVLLAARRTLKVTGRSFALEASVRSGRPLVIGPFLGEVGYELLYWRPWVLRLLRSRGVDPERVTVIGRGGSGAWYADVAGRSVDAFELLPHAEVLRRVEERIQRIGHRKQLAVDPLERELQALAAPGARPVDAHQMFWRRRFAWEGMQTPAEAAAGADCDPLPRGVVPPEVAARLPERFVAIKAYFNECVPETTEARAAFAAVVRAAADQAAVVLLQPGFEADDHRDAEAPANVVRIDDLLRPESNLAVQAAVVARADALVATYGGFSYLGPFLDVPTLAVGLPAGENRHHEAVLHAIRPEARYERVELGVAAIADFLESVVGLPSGSAERLAP
jgi:hypothetical protein